MVGTHGALEFEELLPIRSFVNPHTITMIRFYYTPVLERTTITESV